MSRASVLRKYRAKKAGKLAQAKSGPCTDCGKRYPPCVMDFDHLPGHTKCFNINNARGSYSWPALEKEMAKCELVCSNCHRIRTASRLYEGKFVKPNEELAAFAQELAMQCVAQLQEIYVKDPNNPTEEESNTVVNGIAHVCGTLEGYIIACLPDERKYNVRAALEAMAHAFAKRVNPTTILTPPTTPL